MPRKLGGKQSLKVGEKHSPIDMFQLEWTRSTYHLKSGLFQPCTLPERYPVSCENWWAKGDYTHFRFGIEGPFSGALAVSFREGNSYHFAHHTSNKHKDGNDSNFSNLCGNSGSDLGK